MDMTEKIQEKGQNYLRHDRIFPNGTGGGETDGRKQRIDDRILSGKANMCRDRYGMLWETAGSLLTKERMNEHESQAQGTQRADGGCTVGLPAGLQLRPRTCRVLCTCLLTPLSLSADGDAQLCLSAGWRCIVKMHLQGIHLKQSLHCLPHFLRLD